jgi:hypothetical protein
MLILYLVLLYNFRCTTVDIHKVNYNSLINTIQHCSNELNDALKLINKMSTNECTSGKCIKFTTL